MNDSCQFTVDVIAQAGLEEKSEREQGNGFADQFEEGRHSMLKEYHRGKHYVLVGEVDKDSIGTSIAGGVDTMRHMYNK